jgi:hypothetical protein
MVFIAYNSETQFTFIARDRWEVIEKLEYLYPGHSFAVLRINPKWMED